jgi:hypothetical protein
MEGFGTPDADDHHKYQFRGDGHGNGDQIESQSKVNEIEWLFLERRTIRLHSPQSIFVIEKKSDLLIRWSA